MIIRRGNIIFQMKSVSKFTVNCQTKLIFYEAGRISIYLPTLQRIVNVRKNKMILLCRDRIKCMCNSSEMFSAVYM